MASPSALVYAWLPGSPLAACLNAVAGETCPSQWAQDNDQVPGLLRFKDSSHFLIIAQSVVLEASLREQLQQRQRAQSREMQCHPHFLRKLLPPTTASPLELYLATDSASQHRKKSDGCLLHLFELIVFSINWASCHGLSVFIQNVLMNLIHSFNFPEKKKKIPFLNLLNTDLDFFFCLLYIVPLETCWIVLSFWHWFTRMNFLWECGCREMVLLSAQIISIILMFPSLGPYWMHTKTAVTTVYSSLGLHNIPNINDCSLLWS